MEIVTIVALGAVSWIFGGMIGSGLANLYRTKVVEKQLEKQDAKMLAELEEVLAERDARLAEIDEKIRKALADQ